MASQDERSLVEEILEELEAIRAYDEAVDSGDEAIPFEEAIAEIEAGGAVLSKRRSYRLDIPSVRTVFSDPGDARGASLQWGVTISLIEAATPFRTV